MITSDQASEYLSSALGITVPDFFLSAAIDQVATAEDAMTAAGYSDATATMVQCMAVAVLAAAGSPRRITNQGSASGASRGFQYNADDLTRLRRSLCALDKAGTVTDLVGPDPASGAFMMVV
jgi:hypothetical protein